jgi:predicted ester cyclase
MTDPVQSAVELWRQPPTTDGSAVERFRRAYADPVLINGVPTTCAELVERARATHEALDDLAMEIVDRFDVGDRCAVVFRQSGTHVGRFPGATVEPTGDTVSGIGIDVFTFVEGKIAEIWVVSELSARFSG